MTPHKLANLMKNSKRRKKVPSWLRWAGWVLLVQFILINISAAIYAYRFTHLRETADAPAPARSSNFFKKTWGLFRGPSLYKQPFSADSLQAPYRDFELVTHSGLHIRGWWLVNDTARGTVILFHGLTGNRQSCLAEAYAFYNQGYHALMIDLRNHGRSEGQSTSYGYRETEEISLAYEYAMRNGLKNIFLWGSSMGASAIIKAVPEYSLHPRGIMLEAPFGSLQQHLRGRARTLGFPEQPFAFLVTGWIGLEKGFNAYRYRMSRYGPSVTCPVLLQWGTRDALIGREENQEIYRSFGAVAKQLVEYEDAGHESFLQRDPALWKKRTEDFLQLYSQP